MTAYSYNLPLMSIGLLTNGVDIHEASVGMQPGLAVA